MGLDKLVDFLGQWSIDLPAKDKGEDEARKSA
jgi:hypothetical protein